MVGGRQVDYDDGNDGVVHLGRKDWSPDQRSDAEERDRLPVRRLRKGKWVAVANSGIVKVYNAATGEEVATLKSREA